MTCSSANCTRKVEGRFRWPGSVWADFCYPCIERAYGVAKTMGFELEFYVEPQVALDIYWAKQAEAIFED